MSLPPEARDPQPPLSSALHLIGLGIQVVPGVRTDDPAQSDKRPLGRDWGRRGLSTPEAVQAAFGRVARQVHALLGPSGLCSLDIDDLDGARSWCAARGLDLDAVIEGHPHPIRGRGLRLPFLVPAAVDLQGARMVRGPGGGNLLELRGAPRDGSVAVQDLMPGSWHKAVGRLYAWERGAPRQRTDLPELPAPWLDLYWKLNGNAPARTRRTAAAPERRPPVTPPPLPRVTATALPDGPLDRAHVRAWMEAHHDVRAWLAGYGVPVTGTRTRCIEPGHPDRTPSATVDHRRLYCHVCKVHRDVIDVVQHFEGLGYRAAVARLGYQAGQTVAARPAVTSAPVTDLSGLARHAAHQLHADTPAAHAARALLIRRGLTLADAARFGLGVTDATTPRDLLPRAWDGRAFGPPMDAWRNRLIIPDRTPTGVQVTGRQLDGGHGPRYLHAGGPRGLFGLPDLPAGGDLLLVEGEFDALSVRAACPDLAVAGLPGVARLSSPALTRLNPAGRRVTVLLDADADLHRAARQDPQGPTAAAARALTDQLQAAGAQVWTCPALDGHADLNDALVALGRAAFAQRLRVALERQVRPLNPQRRLC